MFKVIGKKHSAYFFVDTVYEVGGLSIIASCMSGYGSHYIALSTHWVLLLQSTA